MIYNDVRHMVTMGNKEVFLTRYPAHSAKTYEEVMRIPSDNVYLSPVDVADLMCNDRRKVSNGEF